ncbi:MAG: class I SAM-dependent methyltransferase [Magnetococcales bacterium]|nr:class I SAM-dependent methyltransferase [Magnetococcales bacterium]
MSLKDLSQHYAFGDNWRAYAEKINPIAIQNAEEKLRTLLGEDLHNKSFLDIGCGSGLHALAALKAHAVQVMGVDLDPISVATCRSLLENHDPDGPWQCEEKSVFDLSPRESGRFDVVYSWGVLHHTGAMWEAIEKAAAMVKPGGRLAIAIYLATPFCGFWRWEKRLYSASPKPIQKLLSFLFALIKMPGLMILERKLNIIADYRTKRGMDFFIDIHDWLGGYPYQSASPEEIVTKINRLGFTHLKSRRTTPLPFAGLFGSRCAEYLFAKDPVAVANHSGENSHSSPTPPKA